jgi:hypothetical protein
VLYNSIQLLQAPSSSEIIPAFSDMASLINTCWENDLAVNESEIKRRNIPE